MNDCDFCAIASGGEDQELRNRYGSRMSRAIGCAPGVVAMPTLGALGAVHILVLPTSHALSTSAAPTSVRTRLWSTIDAARMAIEAQGERAVVFEHGLSRAGGSGCGTAHAHVHVASVPRSALLEAPAGTWTFRDCTGADLGIDPDREHLVVGLDRDQWLVRYQNHVPSQFLRRWLAATVGREDWDWRKADAMEDVPARRQRLGAFIAA